MRREGSGGVLYINGNKYEENCITKDRSHYWAFYKALIISLPLS